MPNRFSRWIQEDSFSRRCFFGLCFLIPFVAYLDSQTTEGFDKIKFLKTIAEEIITALLLALLVDGPLKSRFAKEISQETWPFASAQGLPKPVREQFLSLLRMPFIREDFVLKITLEDVAGAKGFVRAHLDASFYLRNFSEVRHDYEFRSKVEKSHYPGGEQDRIAYINVKDQDGFPLENEALAKRTVDGGAYFAVPIKLTIPRASEGRLHVHTIRSRVYRECDTHVLDFLESTVGVKICAAGPDDLTWHAQFGSTRVPDPSPGAKPPVWEDRTRLYLPQHAITVHWSRP